MSEEPKKKKRVQIVASSEDAIYTVDEKGEPGILRPAKEGKLVHNPVRVHSTNEDGVVELESLLDGPTVELTKGPTQVSTNKYRKGWDSTFGKKKKKKELLN